MIKTLFSINSFYRRGFKRPKAPSKALKFICQSTKHQFCPCKRARTPEEMFKQGRTLFMLKLDRTHQLKKPNDLSLMEATQALTV